MAVRYNEADVGFPIVSVTEAVAQGSWFIFGPGHQGMVTGGDGADVSAILERTSAVRFEKHRGVYWLPVGEAAGNDADELLCPLRPAAHVVEAPTEGTELTPTTTDDSELPVKIKAKPIPETVSKKDQELHQLTHLPFRSWCEHCVRGKARDDAHFARADPNTGDPRWCMDYFFLSRASETKRATAALNMLDAKSGAVFAALVSKGGDA